MSAPVDSVVNAGIRTQEAATAALRSWADGWQTAAGTQAALADLPDLTARYLSGIRRVLAAQRQLAATAVDLTQTAQTVTDQVTRAAEDALDVLAQAAGGFGDLAKFASAQTGTIADLARFNNR